MQPESHCELSFIVPAFNDARTIADTLDAILAAATQVGHSYELLVVDDASTDGTADVAEAHGARVLRVRNRDLGRTRNHGAKHARGEYLFFVDADTHVNHHVLRAAVRRLHAGDVGGGALFCPNLAHRATARLFARCVSALLRPLRLAPGGFLFVRSNAFHHVGGFDGAHGGCAEFVLSRALQRLGRFALLRETVASHGRSLATLRLRELLVPARAQRAGCTH